MKLRKEIMLFSIISIVFLAGCARAPSPFISGGTNGVIIKTFSPDLTTAEGGNIISFDLFVKNVGATKATNVRATIYGLSSEWTILSTHLGKVFALVPDALSGADPSLNFEGEEGSATFTATTPTGKTVDTTYDVTARVFYSYSTVSENLLRLGTTEYLRSITPPGQPLPKDFGVLKSQSSSGPLLVTVKTRLLTVPSTATSVRVQFEIQNVGGGRIFGESVPAVEANADVSANLDVIPTITVTGGTCGGLSTVTSTKLIGGKSRVLICDVNIPPGTLPSGGYTDKAVDFKLTYNYFVETATQVNVLKVLT